MAKLSAAAHKRAATIPASKAYPQGRFPIPDKNHAKAALFDLPKAKNLSPAQRAAIKRTAERKLGK